MYKILHIPSGSYLLNGYGDVKKYTPAEAIKEIENLITKPGIITWNKYNKHIGSAFSYEEFEIIEIEK